MGIDRACSLRATTVSTGHCYRCSTARHSYSCDEAKPPTNVRFATNQTPPIGWEAHLSCSGAS